MRKAILAAALALGASWAIAQEPAQPAQPAPGKDKEMTATVVATDPVLKTITIKKDSPAGQPATDVVIAVEDRAISNLKTVKAGDKVKLMLKVDPATGKESVSSLEKPKTPPQP
jgi:hypothetical protein